MGIKDIIIILISYIAGCFNTGYYYVRLRYHKDIREVGTNVTGAFNVSRFSGKKGFVITFLGDAVKGCLIVLISRSLECSDIVTLICILLVILGHIFPVQLKFKGGKGLSTAFGAFLAFHPLIILLWLGAFLLLLPIVRKYTVTCLFALMILPLELFIVDFNLSVILFFLLYALVILFACRGNLKDFVKERAYQGAQRKKDKL